MAGAITGPVVPDSVRRWAEQAPEQASKQHTSIASVLAPVFRFLPRLPSMGCDSGYVSQINPFLCCFWSWCFITERALSRTPS